MMRTALRRIPRQRTARHASAAAQQGGGGPLKLAAAGAIGGAIYYNNESIRGSSLYWSIADAGANLLRDGISDAEDAHSYALQLLNLGLGPVAPPADAALETEVFGLTFAAPVGVAAGFDKRGLAHAPLGKMGFGFVEVGGVTPAPQPGNERPRVFRLKEDRAVVNFVGLPSEGAEVVAARLKNTEKTCVVGANVTKNASSNDAVADHAKVVKTLDGCVDFVVVNASCPNVKGGVVDVKAMAALVEVARQNTSVPVLLKVSPDLDERQRRTVARTALRLNLDGLVVANTTSRRPHRDSTPPLFKTPLLSPDVPDRGGLSGPPLVENTRAIVHDFYRKTKGRVPIVGVGGVSSADDAYALIRAGASLVQLYTALVYHGPGLGCEIRDGLVERARRDGFEAVRDAVGADHRDLISAQVDGVLSVEACQAKCQENRDCQFFSYHVDRPDKRCRLCKDDTHDTRVRKCFSSAERAADPTLHECYWGPKYCRRDDLGTRPDGKRKPIISFREPRRAT